MVESAMEQSGRIVYFLEIIAKVKYSVFQQIPQYIGKLHSYIVQLTSTHYLESGVTNEKIFKYYRNCHSNINAGIM